MKVRMLKSGTTPIGTIFKGGVVDISVDMAEEWIETGLAEPVNKPETIKEEKEIAAITPPENAMDQPAAPKTPETKRLKKKPSKSKKK